MGNPYPPVLSVHGVLKYVSDANACFFGHSFELGKSAYVDDFFCVNATPITGDWANETCTLPCDASDAFPPYAVGFAVCGLDIVKRFLRLYILTYASPAMLGLVSTTSLPLSTAAFT